MGLFTRIFGTRSEREIKKIQPTVDKILALESEYAALSDEALQGKTALFKQRLAQGESLDDILPEAFAAIREAAWRVLGMKPYPVQLLGGIVLHQGRIAEMKTGEGKTLVAILPCYLNALTGKGVHVVTVNEYLAKRDSDWMGKVYRYMGLTVGLIVSSMTPEERRVSYAADITYCTNNELGFDYLRDNLVVYKEELVQRGHNFAIVDEVDSILIDEARTPLIISGKGEESSDLYERANAFVATLRKEVFAKTEDKQDYDTLDCDYYVDEKSRTVSLTASGVAKAEKFFNIENLGDADNATTAHHINQAMKARGLMKRDVDYVVKDGEIIIVDQFTGRLMHGRRYNEGLHQAIEAKEKVTVASESKTLATITFQNFFRLYSKLSGMTGTALTEQEEFGTIYALDVVEIPTNKPVARIDNPDAIFTTEESKYDAIVNQVKLCHEKGQPVLVGTISIERSEMISKLLKKEGIPHSVLNAKFHDQEAMIVAQAGKLGAVTIATNMAGRGTDIMLGGNPDFLAKQDLQKMNLSDELLAEADSHAETSVAEVLEVRAKYAQLLQSHKQAIAGEAEQVRQAGGLFIIGTERHESRRIDNQLRGRSGRQGDPGESRFFVSTEDDLFRQFGGDRFKSAMNAFGMKDGMPTDLKMTSKIMENAQKNVESVHFRHRKNVLEYDNVVNSQREVIYKQRQKVLDNTNLRESILSMLRQSLESDAGDVEALKAREGLFYPVGSVGEEPDIDRLYELAVKTYEMKEAAYTPEQMREAERRILLRTVDQHWMEHIDALDDLKQGIHLRAYAQHDPVVEYKNESYDMFVAMNQGIREETVQRLFAVRIIPQQNVQRKRVAVETGASAGGMLQVKRQPERRSPTKVGANDDCPCGSGKKYKNCCRRQDQLKGLKDRSTETK